MLNAILLNAENDDEVYMKKIFVTFALCFAFILNVYAQSVTLIMIQNDKVDKIKDLTILMESEIMNTFFDNGFIITNEPAVSASEENLAASLCTAKTGGISFIVPITINYKEDIKSGEEKFLKSIESVSWEIISNGSELNTACKGSSAVVVNKPQTLKETQKALKVFSANLATEIGNKIRNL